MSASNTPDGVDVDVYWGNADTPKYSTTLARHSIPHDIDRVTREQMPHDVGTTTFYDVTMRPGRSTVVIDGVELDKLKTQGRQMTFRESEGCIVPLKLADQSGGSKPGNAGAGKAPKPVRVATGTLFGHSAGFRAISWQDVAGQSP